MFGWFRPTCPVDPRAKNWIETRLAWLADEFGLDVFTRRSIILPLQEYFPDNYDGSEAAAKAYSTESVDTWMPTWIVSNSNSSPIIMNCG